VKRRDGSHKRRVTKGVEINTRKKVGKKEKENERKPLGGRKMPKGAEAPPLNRPDTPQWEKQRKP